MAINKEAHAMYMLHFRVFVECKKNENRGVSLKRLEELFPKWADYILSWMQWEMYGPHSLYHATSADGGIAWYLKEHIYAMNNAEFQEYYKQHHSIR